MWYDNKCWRSEARDRQRQPNRLKVHEWANKNEEAATLAKGCSVLLQYQKWAGIGEDQIINENMSLKNLVWIYEVMVA